MKITQIETIRVRVDPNVIWVQLHTDAGLIGLGETYHAPTAVQAAIHDYFGPLLIGRDPFAIERHWMDMFALSEWSGYGGAEMRAISALDTALWDIKGQAVDLPVYELLGGAVRSRIRVYATAMPNQGAADVAKRLLDEGITAIKGNTTDAFAIASDGQHLSSADLDRSLLPIREIRDAVGLEMEIANDNHSLWNLPIAIRIAQAMEDYEIMWQEDLLQVLRPEALRELQDATRTPVCVSERVLGRWQYAQYIEGRATRIVMPDLVWTGGISETNKIATLASVHQLPVAPHDATGPVSIFASAHICMNAPTAMIQEFVPEYLDGWYQEFVDPNLEIRDGYLHAPRRPGIGTRLKPEVRDRPDATVVTSDVPDFSMVEMWEPDSDRTPALEAEVQRRRQERGPQL
jgi:galactonate dehydratase